MRLRIAAIALLATVSASAQQIDTTTSLRGGQFTLPSKPNGEEKLSAWLRIDHTNYDRWSRERIIEEGQEGHDLQSWDYITWTLLEMQYTLTERLTVGLTLSFAEFREYSTFPPNITTVPATGAEVYQFDRDSYSGIGDSRVWGHYLISDEKWKIGARAGFEAPTGESDERFYNDRKIRGDSQPGDGAWSLYGGFAAGVYGETWDFNLALTGAIHTRGTRDFQIGPSLRLSLGVAANLLSTDSKAKLQLTFDMWLDWKSHDEFRRHVLRDSDGVVWVFAPGLRFNLKPFFAQLALPWEWVNDIDENADEAWRVVLSAGLQF